MPGMMVEPSDLRAQIREHHVSRLTELEQVVLIARCHGNSHALIGESLGYSEPRVRAIFEHIQDVTIGYLGLKRDLAVTTLWMDEHLECVAHCLSIGKRLIEEKSFLTSA